MTWLVLGFDYDAVMERWEDARFAQALEDGWIAAGKPADAEAYVATSSGECPFRFWLNAAAARLVNGAWRPRLVAEPGPPPENARPILPPP